ncbi:hypothetical protein [Aquimonas voraii]|uniref:DUF4124 domain-containing protein n=1 Tax=Aquimonas voraii TaxID=265719 RepID=A0A1G6WVS2_9GAMM|nr:hypothetical protein [Aquimonas voraii]SDD69931.1 hypothetical protein SAMN04488509_105190 [Aquimonas voraii]
MRILLPALLFALACSSSDAAAKVYKCPLPGGGHEYRQIACDGEGSGEVEVNDPTVSRRADTARAPDTADAGDLVGDWCEIGVSTTIDSEIALDGIHWYFGPDYLTYVHSRAWKPAGMEPPKYPLQRKGEVFVVDDPMFGGVEAEWTVVGRREGVILVEGPMGGILHMRPGRC